MFEADKNLDKFINLYAKDREELKYLGTSPVTDLESQMKQEVKMKKAFIKSGRDPFLDMGFGIVSFFNMI